MKLRHVHHSTFDKLICAIFIICLAVVLVLVLALKDSLRTYFKSLSLSWSLGVRPLSLGVRSRRSLSLSWSLGVRSLSLSRSLEVRSLLTSLVLIQVSTTRIVIIDAPTETISPLQGFILNLIESNDIHSTVIIMHLVASIGTGDQKLILWRTQMELLASNRNAKFGF